MILRRATNIGDASGRDTDVLTKLWRWSCPCAEHIKVKVLFRADKSWIDFTWKHIPCGCRMRSQMKNKSLLFCWRVTGSRVKIENTGATGFIPFLMRNIAIASHIVCRAVQEHLRASTIDHPNHRRFGDIITSNLHCRFLQEHAGNIADISPMCLRHL